MSRQGQQFTAVAILVLVILAFSVLKPTGFDPAEAIWTMCGAIGAVYGWYAWRRRAAVNQWRKSQHINGLFALTAQQHVTLRGVGLGIQLLIMSGGLLAMFNANRLLIIGTLIGVAVLSTFGAWYAEQKAEQQSRYIHSHPEPDPS